MELFGKSPLSLRIVDLRLLKLEERGEAQISYLKTNVPCSHGGGHRWSTRHWIPEQRAWHWGPCLKCDGYRIVQTTGNYITWHPKENRVDGLIVNNDFDDMEKQLNQIFQKLPCFKSHPLWHVNREADKEEQQ